MTTPIDVDDPTSWPSSVYEIVADWAEECDGKTQYTSDLPLRLEFEASFRQTLAGYLLRAYHYTRLLPHEQQMVSARGLRMLSADLVSEQIEAACAIGAISTAEAETFHKAHVFAAGEQEYRENQVYLVLSKGPFERDFDGCLPLLESWRGEGIYRSSGSARSVRD